MILVSSDETGTFNAFGVATDGHRREQLTKSTNRAVHSLDCFPEDGRLLLSIDSGGDEFNHIHVREVEGSLVDLTPGDTVKAAFLGWAGGGRSFFVATNERDPRFFDAYEYCSRSYDRRVVFRNDGGYAAAVISPDRCYAALMRIKGHLNSDIFLYDLASRDLTHLTRHEKDVRNEPLFFSQDGSRLYFLSDQESEFSRLVQLDLTRGVRDVLVAVDGDVVSAKLSKLGSYLVAETVVDGQTILHLHCAKTMETLPVPAVPNAAVNTLTFSRDETRVCFYASGSRVPGDLYYADLRGGAPVCIARSLGNEIDTDDLVEGRVVRFSSFDGVEVPGVLYSTRVPRKSKQVCGLIWAHGGPSGQARHEYHPLIQFLVQHGYSVFAVNYRGSSGYGKSFLRLGNRRHGRDDLADCVAGKQVLVAEACVDPRQIGIIGFSYGGFLALAALAFRPEEFSVGVDLFGISNWVQAVKSIPPWWEPHRAALQEQMGDFEDEDFFRAKSPLFHASRVTKPLMVVQGGHDSRVSKSDTDEMVAAVRANHVAVEYLLFEDEGHGLAKKRHRARAYQSVLTFLDRYLMGP